MSINMTTFLMWLSLLCFIAFVCGITGSAWPCLLLLLVRFESGEA